MNLTSVIKINNVVCERIGKHHAIMNGRKIDLHKHVYITNHCLTGRFHAIKRLSKVKLDKS